MKKRELYKVEDNKIIRLRRTCPKCGDGVFLAEHKDRLSCGTCGYTEFKSKKEGAKKQIESKPEIHEEQPKKVDQEAKTEESLEEKPSVSVEEQTDIPTSEPSTPEEKSQ